MSEEKLVQRNIRFTESLWERVEALVPQNKRSEFVRNAVEAALVPLEVKKLRERLDSPPRRTRPPEES